MPLPSVAVSAADVPGPIVSISPTTAPAALSRLISPASPELLATVNVCVPVVPEVHSGAQPVFVTVMAIPAVVAAAGSAAIVAPAARAGTATRTPATAHGRASGEALPLAGGRGSLRRGSGLSGLLAGFSAGFSAGLTTGPAVTNAGMTTAR